jgi:hypothetical protein
MNKRQTPGTADVLSNSPSGFYDYFGPIPRPGGGLEYRPGVPDSFVRCGAPARRPSGPVPIAVEAIDDVSSRSRAAPRWTTSRRQSLGAGFTLN